MIRSTSLCMLMLGSFVVGCGSGGGDAATTASATAAPPPPAPPPPPAKTAAHEAPSAHPSASSAASSEASGSASASPDGPAAGEPKYATEGLKLVPANCKKAHVLLSTAPDDDKGKGKGKGKGKDKGHFKWPYFRQALRAHPEFRKHPFVFTEVELAKDKEKDKNKGKALLVKCESGEDCNRIAAMYKAVARSSHPEIFCGDVPHLSQERTRLDFEGFPTNDGKLGPADVPKETLEQCTRLAACMIRKNPMMIGDPALECQKHPGKFKTECAEKATCEDVVRCAGKDK